MRPDSNMYTISILLHLMLIRGTLAEASGKARVTRALAGWDVKMAVLTTAHSTRILWNLWQQMCMHTNTDTPTNAHKKHANAIWASWNCTSDHFTQISCQHHHSRTVILVEWYKQNTMEHAKCFMNGKQWTKHNIGGRWEMALRSVMDITTLEVVVVVVNSIFIPWKYNTYDIPMSYHIIHLHGPTV